MQPCALDFALDIQNNSSIISKNLLYSIGFVCCKNDHNIYSKKNCSFVIKWQKDA